MSNSFIFPEKIKLSSISFYFKIFKKIQFKNIILDNKPNKLTETTTEKKGELSQEDKENLNTDQAPPLPINKKAATKEAVIDKNIHYERARNEKKFMSAIATLKQLKAACCGDEGKKAAESSVNEGEKVAESEVVKTAETKKKLSKFQNKRYFMHIGFGKKSHKKRKSKKKGKTGAKKADVKGKSDKEKESSQPIDHSLCELEGKNVIGGRNDLGSPEATSNSEFLFKLLN